MAEKRRVLDVWIVQTNTVYREVPYTVVTDWIQQGRLLAEDKVRSPGTEKWHLLGKVSTLAAYLPRAEPFRAEDQAEALEPVEVGFDWKARRSEIEDDDVDMIPLIDISLVLLIFFMMTAAISSGILSPIDTPPARHQLEALSQDTYWVGIDRKKDAKGNVEKGADGKPLPVYSVGNDEGPLKDADAKPLPVNSQGAVTDALRDRLGNVGGEVRLRMRADKNLPVETVREMTVALQRMEAKMNEQRPAGAQGRLRLDIVAEVSEPQSR